MSLRLLRKLVVALLAMIVLASVALLFLRKNAPGDKASDDFRALAGLAEVTRGSLLKPGGPAVEFTLPAATAAFRILTNANLSSIDAARDERRLDRERRWHYAVEIEELDASGRIRERNIHHFRRDLVEVSLPQGRRGTGSFYLDDGAPVPLPAATLRLNYAPSSAPSRVRVRLVESDGDIDSVLVRAAVPAPVSQQDGDIKWHRLREEQREKLAMGNVYPPALLSERERANVVESRWLPVGPTGDFPGRDIYVLLGDEIGAPVEPGKGEMLTVGPGRLVTVQLPEDGGRVHLVLEGLGEVRRGPGKVNVRWIGHSAFLRRDATQAWKGARFELRDSFAGGWLEITATREARVRVSLVETGGERDITPPVQYLRAWAARNDAPLDFSLTHAGSEATPLRLVMRRSGIRPDTKAVKLTFYGKDGEAVREERIVPQFVMSRHDMPWPLSGERVSDPWEVFFNVPPKIAKVRIASPELVLVNAYTRPADLPREIRMPEDTYLPDAGQTVRPGWFAINPDGYETRILDGKSSLLTVQGRPPEDRPDLAAGRYQWEEFDPLSDGAARVFLAPREAGVPDRDESIGSTYRPLQENIPANFQAAPGRSTVTARLAWTAQAPVSFHYTVFLDDREWVSGAAAGRAGEIALPPFSPGSHRLRVSSDANLVWYASNLAHGAPWVRRRAYRFDKPLSFEIDRSILEKEFVSVRLFRPAGDAARARLRVKISGLDAGDRFGPLPGWLFAERVYDIRPSGELALPVAETGSERTDAGQPFYLPIPDGAPRGRYRITLIPDDRRGWITMSRITPGMRMKPELITESIADE